MSLFASLFGTKENKSVVLIDIGADTIGGAIATYSNSSKPTLLYTRRLPIEVQEGEERESAMLRAVEILGTVLIRDGMPALVRATGNQTLTNVLVSIDAPWQETKVRVEQIEKKEGFLFTQNVVNETVASMAPKEPQKNMFMTQVIGTTLNGYEIPNPYGKRAHHAAIVILTSVCSQVIYDTIHSTIANQYHLKHVTLISGSLLRYQAIRATFPHENDALIVDATGHFANIALIRKSLLVAVSELSGSDTSTRESGDDIVRGFAEIGKYYPLPRTIFLLAREQDVAGVQKRLATMNVGALWLSDNQPRVVTILPSKFASQVRQMSTPSQDLQLLLEAVYYEKRTAILSV